MYNLPRVPFLAGIRRLAAPPSVPIPKAPSEEEIFIPPDVIMDGEEEEESNTSPSSNEGFSSSTFPSNSISTAPTILSFSAPSPTSPTFNEPFIPNTLQPIRAYRFRPSRGAWKHVPTLSTEEVRDMLDDEDRRYPTSVRVVTWNIDAMTKNHEARLLTALRHIERDVLLCKDGEAPFEACCICLQEVHKDMIPVLMQDEWVMRNFAVTPTSASKWPQEAFYGNVTLVSKVLTVVRCEILHYGMSRMERTALAVYVLLSEPEPSAENVVICVVNTHLESLEVGSTKRPKQMELAARYLKQVDVRGGVVVGDMNPVGQEDEGLAMAVGLRDTWRKGNHESGHTWGYQGNTGGYPPARFDKILYFPRRGYRMDPPERIGVGVKVKDSGVWVSDHYGLESTLRLVARRNSA